MTVDELNKILGEIVKVLAENDLAPGSLTAEARGQLAARALACVNALSRGQVTGAAKRSELKLLDRAFGRLRGRIARTPAAGDVPAPEDLRRAAACVGAEATPAIRAAAVSGYVPAEGDTPAIDALEADLLNLRPARITCKTRPRSGKDFKLNTEG